MFPSVFKCFCFYWAIYTKRRIQPVIVKLKIHLPRRTECHIDSTDIAQVVFCKQAQEQMADNERSCSTHHSCLLTTMIFSFALTLSAERNAVLMPQDIVLDELFNGMFSTSTGSFFSLLLIG